MNSDDFMARGRAWSILQMLFSRHSLTSTTIIAFEKKKTMGCSTPWWNNQLDKLRKKARKLFNRAMKHNTPEDWDRYKVSWGEYKKAIKRARSESWRKFTTDMSTLSNVAKLLRILNAENSARLSLLKDASRIFTETEEETLHLLTEKNFSDFRAIGTEEGGRLADNRRGL